MVLLFSMYTVDTKQFGYVKNRSNSKGCRKKIPMIFNDGLIINFKKIKVMMTFINFVPSQQCQ